MGRISNVCGHHRLVHVGWYLPEDTNILPHQPVKRRPPRRKRHRVDQGDGVKVPALQEVRSERGCAAEVVADDVWLIQAPVVQELSENSPLGGQGDILAFPFLRSTVSDEV